MLVSLVLNSGVSAEELAHVSGVPLETITGGTLIPYDEGMRLWRAAEQLTGDAAVGLRSGSTYGVDQLGALGSAFGHAPSLRAALSALARLLPLVIRDAPMELSDEGSVGRFRYVSPGLERHGVDCMFAAVVKAARDCTRRPIALASVDLQAPAPRDPTPYRSFFGTLPRWGQGASVMTFHAADLDAAMRGAEPTLALLLEDRAAALLDTGPTPIALEVAAERAVYGALLEGALSIETVAASLGRSPRSLQRQLHDAGTSFAAIRDRVLLERARALLDDRSRSITQIAGDLGFATRAAFARAFRRWTGMSPGEARSARPG